MSAKADRCETQTCPGGPPEPDLSRDVTPGAAPVWAGPIGLAQDAARTGGFTNCAVLAVCPLTWTKPQDIVAARTVAPFGPNRTADKHRRYCNCLTK